MEELGGQAKSVGHVKDWVEQYIEPRSPDPYDNGKIVHFPMPSFHKDILDACESGSWLLINVPREFSKSTIVTVGYSCYRIAGNRNVCGGIISNTYDQAAGFMRGVKTHLDSNRKILDDYGTFKAEQGWRDDQFTVIRSNTAEVNATMFAAGAGKAILGKHTDFLILDDVEDKKTVQTPESRKKTREWYSQTVIPILRSGGQMIVIGTRKHWDDLYINILNGNLPGPSRDRIALINAAS